MTSEERNKQLQEIMERTGVDRKKARRMLRAMKKETSTVTLDEVINDKVLTHGEQVDMIISKLKRQHKI